MQVVRAAIGTVLVLLAALSAAALLVSIPAISLNAQQPNQTPAPATQKPAVPAPGQTPQPGQTVPGQPTTAQPGVATPAAPQPRTFAAPVGLLFNTVRADRVDDFEKAMGYLQSALAASTNERVREQAAGWRIFKATEAAPGGAALYVFLLDPTVVGADYSLSRILADAYPDQAKLQEVWKLYSGAVTGGSLLNLTPFKAPPLTPTTTKP